MPSWRAAMERRVAGEQLGQANATIYNLNAYIETLNKQQNNITLEINKFQEENIQLKQQLDALYHSKSWKITKPLRLLTQLIKK
jgi:hypothetical protein